MPITSERETAGRKANFLPFPVYRTRHGALAWYQPIVEAWCVLTRQCSLHKAWNTGFADGARCEYRRIMINGGDLVRVVDAAIYETSRNALNGAEPQYETLRAIRRSTFEKLAIGQPTLSRVEVDHG